MFILFNSRRHDQLRGIKGCLCKLLVGTAGSFGHCPLPPIAAFRQPGYSSAFVSGQEFDYSSWGSYYLFFLKPACVFVAFLWHGTCVLPRLTQPICGYHQLTGGAPHVLGDLAVSFMSFHVTCGEGKGGKKEI